MTRGNEWATKMMVLIKGGNTTAALAQIKVAPTVKDLRALQTSITLARLNGRYPHVDAAIADNIDLLAAPRLHRAP
jgi:hypothetical protein